MLVSGGSGSGKTRFYVKPNLMRNVSPLPTIPPHSWSQTQKAHWFWKWANFQRAGYRVKILNTINFSKSMKYNPFVHIHSERRAEAE